MCMHACVPLWLVNGVGSQRCAAISRVPCTAKKTCAAAFSSAVAISRSLS